MKINIFKQVSEPETFWEWILLIIASICIIAIASVIIGYTFFKLNM